MDGTSILIEALAAHDGGVEAGIERFEVRLHVLGLHVDPVVFPVGACDRAVKAARERISDGFHRPETA